MAQPKAPAGLAARGRRLWRESLAAGEYAPGHLVLLEEACRIADRLELLDRLIRTGATRPRARAAESGEDSGGSGTVAGHLAESRQQQTAFKAILSELRQGQRTSGPVQTAGGSGVADLTARIAERRRKPES